MDDVKLNENGPSMLINPTTGQQELQLEQLETIMLNYAPEVCNELMQFHRRGNFVKRPLCFSTKSITLGHLWPWLIHSFKLSLFLCKGKRLVSCSGLDQAYRVVQLIMV